LMAVVPEAASVAIVARQRGNDNRHWTLVDFTPQKEKP